MSYTDVVIGGLAKLSTKQIASYLVSTVNPTDAAAVAGAYQALHNLKTS